MDYYNSNAYFTSNEYKEHRNEIDMLNGNIARVCVTDDIDDLRFNHSIALNRLERIFEYRLKILSERAKHETT